MNCLSLYRKIRSIILVPWSWSNFMIKEMIWVLGGFRSLNTPELFHNHNDFQRNITRNESGDNRVICHMDNPSVLKETAIMDNTLAPTLFTRSLPLVDRRLRDLMLIVAGSLLVAGMAQVRVALPFTPIPITGQTFAVLLVGASLGSFRGAASLALYLLLGVLGLPFFAGGSGGLSSLLGPTGGYLVGFVVAASLVGLLAARGLDRHIPGAFLAFLAGEIVIYLFGVAWLSLTLGIWRAVVAGFLPFLLGDAIKLVAAGLALPATWALVNNSKP
jgi:biotin transport system substrate-specific component